MVTPLSELTEQERAQAVERFHVLRPFLEEDIPLLQIASQQQVSLRTLRRWIERYHIEGLPGLIRKRRADRGERRRLPSYLQQFVEGLALQTPPLSVAIIHRKVCELAQQHDLKPPSYGLVYDIVRQLPTALTTLAHEGAKAYKQRFDLLHRREAQAPNEIWQADHCLLDILLVCDGQAPAKPWLTVVMDDYSRAVAGYFLTFDAPSALNTSLALRQAIWRKGEPRWHVCGIPQILYTDCGSDFKSQHIEQVSLDLKIRLMNSMPGQPRGRGRMPQSPVRGHPELTLSDLDTRFRAFVFDVYHDHPHSETTVPPQERGEAGGFLPQMPDSLEQLDLLLLTVPRPRKIHRDGIRFMGQRYMDPTLAAYVGESVVLRYDPRDVAEVRVFYQDRFLCRAICQEWAGATVPLRDIMKARNRQRRELRQFIQDREQVVESLLHARRGQLNAVETADQFTTSELETTRPPQTPAPRLKRYFNEP